MVLSKVASDRLLKDANWLSCIQFDVSHRNTASVHPWSTVVSRSTSCRNLLSFVMKALAAQKDMKAGCLFQVSFDCVHES